MSSTPALPDPANLANSTQMSQRDEDAQYYREMLHELAEMGMDIARAVHRQALAEPAPPSQPAAPRPNPQHAIAFDRLARTVRRTIALARKLAEPDRAPAREAPGPKSRPTHSPQDRRTYAAEPCERPEGPDCDADEDLDDELDEQSFADLIASLRHDTGLATLTDAQFRQLRTTPKPSTGPASTEAGRTARPESAPSHAESHDPVATPPAQPGTGPPE